tara:strand:+ start:29 stop:313 length:285 start_codon:yes stop_codon:yes gene_type:complete
MTNLENTLIEMGLKVWEKGAVKRIYVKADTIKQIIDFDYECKINEFLEKNTKSIFSDINNEGAWLNCETGKLESRKPRVQAWFRTSPYAEKFGY